MTAAPIQASELDQAPRDALRRLVLTLADSKRLMGIRYSDWLLGAPSIETGIAASAMTQDEWGHARLLYSMLKEFGVDPGAVEHERATSEYASVDALDRELPDWAALVAAMFIVDGALTVALDSFARGRYESARSRVPKMISEEEFHGSLAEAWYRRLAASSEEARGLLRNATMEMLPSTLAWLGAADAPARSLVEAGIMEAGPVLLETFTQRVGPLLAEAGVDVGSVAPSEEWDADRGRGPGHPDEESAARARGDANRQLLVD
ncbi:MAG: phenylacetate-CoA oxygenase subunit PaaI [Gemmatimonadota bacterium]|nr:phenylacetate-CoA oxygenase subunit PaaI [Gemmatimonadota bacterium]MDH5760574.1 phenylacetate-CoA oxygenase subunit PaaI [Gemmatimonadota bacterium]